MSGKADQSEDHKVTISRILHAGYIFTCAETQIAFDPIFENPFSRNCRAFPNVQFDLEKIKKLRLDAVFISHYHDDHCSLESLDLLDRQTPIYIYCLFDELFTLVRALGFSNVQPLQLDKSVYVGSFEVMTRRALDVDVDSIFHIKAAGLNILNVVDSWIDPSTLKILHQEKWDMILWPFQTMAEIEVLSPSCEGTATGELPFEWIEQLQTLNPRYLVPSSCQFVFEDWSWYNQKFFPISYQKFQTEMQAALPAAKVMRLNPGVSMDLTATSYEFVTPLDWVEPSGDQDVDYVYDADLQPPPTAEVARRFTPLTAEETARVLNYCGDGLLEKFRALEPLEDSYFSKPRVWRLAIYDHDGELLEFRYHLTPEGIAHAPNDDKPLSWCTEVPISRLYAALELGEALTSMYMRINNHVFSEKIAEEIAAADVTEDPLMRCLFTGVFASYQKTQLKKLTTQPD